MTPIPFLLTLFSIAVACTIRPNSPPPSAIPLSNTHANLNLSLNICNTQPERLRVTSNKYASIQGLSATLQAPRCYNVTLQLQFSHASNSNVTISANRCSYTFPLIVSGITILQNGRIVSVPSTKAAVIRPDLRARLEAQVVFPNGTQITGADLAPFLQVELQDAPRTLTSFVVKSTRNVVIDASRFVTTSNQLPTRFLVKVHVLPVQLYTQFTLRIPPFVPIVRRIRTSGPLQITGGAVVSVQAQFAFGSSRRLVLFTADQRVTIPETSCTRRRSRFTCSFLLPDTRRVGFEPRWIFQVTRGTRIITAIDESNFTFRFQRKPIITAVSPSSASRADTLIALTGSFPNGRLRIRFGGENVGFLRRTSTQLFLTVPSHMFDEPKQVEIIVTVNGRRSAPYRFRIDPDAIDVDLIPLQASFDSDSRFFFFPTGCGEPGPPVVKARPLVDNLFDIPRYEFSTLALGDIEFKSLVKGSSSIVTLPERLFSTEVEADDVLAVRVRVVFDDNVGEKVILVSRQLRDDIIGVTVSQIPRTVNQVESCILESSVASAIQCPNLRNLVLRFDWRLDGDIIRSRPTEQTSLASLSRPTLLGFDNRLAIPLRDSSEQSFELSVRLLNRNTRTLIREGFASGTKTSAPEQMPVALINGGAAQVWVPQNVDNYIIEGDIASVMNPSKDTIRYRWSCVNQSQPTGRCPTTLFPFSRTIETRNVPSFAVSTVNTTVNSTFIYSLQAVVGDMSTEVTNLSLLVADEGLAPFPAASFLSSSGSIADGSSFDGISPIIFALSSMASAIDIDFALFAENNSTDDILRSREDLLIRQSGYWTPDDPSALFLGINPRDLEAGNYTLYAALNDTAGPGRGASWFFELEEVPRLVIDEPVIMSGEANRTLFYASASSVPNSNSLFFFALRNTTNPEAQDMTGPLVDPGECLQGCTGADTVSFTVPMAGEFNIVVDMYDSSGTVLIASASTVNSIEVERPMNKEDGMDNSTNKSIPIAAARALANEGAIFEATQQLISDPDARQRDFAQSIRALDRISSSSFPVPLQAAVIIELSAGIMDREEVRRFGLLERLRDTVNSTVQRSPLSEPIGTVLTEPLLQFYSAATNKLLSIKSMMENDMMDTRQDSFAEAVMETRLAASSNIILVLSAGQSCGTLEQVTVGIDVDPAFNLSSGNADVEVVEDFRIGVNCFPGQIESLPPEPADFSVCAESVTRNGSIGEDLRIVASSEQYNLMQDENDEDITDGIILTTQVLGRSTEIGNGSLIDVNERISDCYVSEPSARISEEIGQGVASLSGIESVFCEDGGEIVNGDQVLASVDEFNVDADGRISASITRDVTGSLELRVNETRMNVCLTDLEGDDSSVSLAVLLPVLLAAVAVLLLLIIGYFVRRRRRRNENSGDLGGDGAGILEAPERSRSMSQNSNGSSRVVAEDLDLGDNEYGREYREAEERGSEEGSEGSSEEASEGAGSNSVEEKVASRGMLQPYEKKLSRESVASDGETFVLSGEVGGDWPLPQDYIVRDAYGRGYV